MKPQLLSTLAIGSLLAADYGEYREPRYGKKQRETGSKPHRNRTPEGQRRRKLNNIAKKSRAKNRG